MADLQKDFLFVLIKSLSTSEKRQFKLYVNRLGINADSKFLLLFSEMEKMQDYDEDQIIQKKISTKKQLSNLKAHLYKQILVSLRLSPSHQNNRIQIREQLDFATILYQKGLHRQALKILDKAKNNALDLDEKTLASDIIDLEKVIESQYITRSRVGRAADLIEQSESLSIQNIYATKLSNLALMLYNEMLTNGYAKNEQDKVELINYFNSQIKSINFDELNFRGKLWYYKANVWKYLLLQDYRHAYKYSKKWVELFYDHPEMIINHPVWYIKGNTNLMKILFLTVQVKKLEYWYKKFIETTAHELFNYNENLNSLVFLTYYNTKMNIHFAKSEFVIGTNIIPELEKKINKYKDKIDEHHFQILYLKMAALCFGAKKYLESIKYCEIILKTTNTHTQEDLRFHTNILHLMSMFESGADEDYDQNVQATEKFVHKMSNSTPLHLYIIEFFKNLNNHSLTELSLIFKNFNEQLTQYNKNNFNTRTLVYIDIKSWALAKATGKDVIEIIGNKTN